MKQILFFLSPFAIVFSIFMLFTSSTVSAQDINNVACPAPIITNFSPINGPVNTEITITGSNFNVTNSADFSGINASFTVINDTEIIIIVPDGVADTSTISLTSSGGCSGNSSNTFDRIDNDCTTSTSDEIYISEAYDSDGGSYGVIELYNPTNAIVNLDGVYQIDRYGDIGNAAPSFTIPLTGSINPFDTFIVELGSDGNTCNSLVSDINVAAGINDNDEIELLKNAIPIDVLYTDVNIGYTYIRNPDAVVPSTTFNISDWMFSDTEDCSDLGMHTEDPVITPTLTHPLSQDICANDTATFSVSIDMGSFTYQWNILDASGNWINVINDANYSGATTNTLTISNTPGSFDGNQYYCELISTNCDLLSNAVQLQVLNPLVDTITNQTECDEFILPALTDGTYFTGTNGSETQLNAGDIITSSQTIYIFNEIGTAPNTCSNESSFDVTIIGLPDVDTLSDQDACTDFTLAALTNGNYFTGTNGSGTQLNAGDVISTSQTIYIYNEVGTAPNTCSNESSFEITINGTPNVDTIVNQTECDEFILPALTDGTYFTETNGSGTQLNAGDIITSSQTIYIFNEIGTAPNTCSNESSFDVTIIGLPDVDTLSDQDACSDFTLPALTNGNYFTGTNGSGTQLNAGDVISTSQTIYIYNEVGTAPNTCSNESSFEITINGTPNVDTIADQTECDAFILPALTDGTYFTETNGSGTQLNAGDIITSSQTIYIFNEIGTAPNTCSNESSFEVTITGLPDVDTLSDQDACSDFTLPALTNGNYFTGTNGSGTQLNAGDVISTSQTIYIYNEVGTAPNTCSNESSFEITINGTPNVDTIANQTECDAFILPALTDGTYFTGTNGSGTQLNAGDVITSSQTIYIFNEIGTAPNTCSNESSFEVTITGLPDVDILSDQEACGEYILPTLTNGNYYSEMNGSGTQFNAGDVITTSQTIYIYIEAGTPPNTCSNESSFEVTINTGVDFDLTDANISITEDIVTVNMTDTSINYDYAVDSTNFQDSNIFTNLSDGSHVLYVRDGSGCIIKTLTFDIETTLFIPLYFTPNEDGYKDYWKVIDTQNSIKEIFIFNRYGKLLKQLAPNSTGWNGLYNGNILESNDYWYVITLKDGGQLRGHFTLKH